MNIHGIFHRFTISARSHAAGASSVCRWNNLRQYQAMCTLSKEEAEAKDFFDFMDSLKNYEKLGLPKGSGTESEDGFDLGRMSRLMGLLGNPQCKFKSVHVAGTKGKGSTAAFLSGILRAEGYSVGCYTSPHIRTIRERITLGALGGPVPASLLNHHFQCVKMVLERAIELENGCLTHFEVLTALAFSLFAQQNVDIAVIEAGLGGARDATNVIPSSALAAAIITTIGEEHLAALGGSLESIAVAKSGIIKEGRPVRWFPLHISICIAPVARSAILHIIALFGIQLEVVLGGPFLPHIEHILRDKASSMSSPVVSVAGTGNKSALRSHDRRNGRPFQFCDLVLQIEKDLQLSIEMFDVKLSMLGQHQLQNAATATCAALCLRDQGWNLSDESVRAGLQSAFLLGRNQILTSNEAERLGLPGATIMLDGAHTKESAAALVNTIKMAFPESSFVLVVAMANDKDHIGFARELLSGLSTPRVIFSIATEKDMNLLRFSLAATALKAVFFTEVSIAGEKSRTTSASCLRESWIQASKEKNTDVLDYRIDEHEIVGDPSFDQSEGRAVIFSEGPLMACIGAGGQILGAKTGAELVVVVTGSLHIVSAVLCSIEG